MENALMIAAVLYCFSVGYLFLRKMDVSSDGCERRNTWALQWDHSEVLGMKEGKE